MDIAVGPVAVYNGNHFSVFVNLNYFGGFARMRHNFKCDHANLLWVDRAIVAIYTIPRYLKFASPPYGLNNLGLQEKHPAAFAQQGGEQLVANR